MARRIRLTVPQRVDCELNRRTAQILAERALSADDQDNIQEVYAELLGVDVNDVVAQTPPSSDIDEQDDLLFGSAIAAFVFSGQADLVIAYQTTSSYIERL